MVLAYGSPVFLILLFICFEGASSSLPAGNTQSVTFMDRGHHDVMYNKNAVFDVTVRSKLECAVVCRRLEDCRAWSHVPETEAASGHGQCRGYKKPTQEITVSSHQAGARTYDDTVYKEIHTSDVFGYRFIFNEGIDIRGQTDFKVKIKACYDVHIGLAQYLNTINSKFYELVIGAGPNTYSIIRKSRNGWNEARVDAVVLDCNNFVDFWFSWAGGVIGFGLGNKVGEGQLASYTHSSPYNVRYLAITTGYGADGTFLFPDE